MSAVSQLERAIARILLIRYEQDIARLFSTRLYNYCTCALQYPNDAVHNSRRFKLGSVQC
jgi:hypothetical protein